MASNIYTQKDANVRRTYALFMLFFVVIIGVGWFFSYLYNSPGILVFAVLFSSVMSFASYWWSDSIVLAMNHAVPVEEKDNRELYHLVENLSIASGLPMPRIFLVDDPSPNAFATGRDPAHGVIAVTRGLLERLDKQELEGVLAHELSHIGNRDTLISTVAVILVGFITILADMFRRSMLFGGFRSRDREGGQAGAILMLIGVIFSILAPISAMLLQLAISRRRESLADASGALLTRYPEGLASALEKISADPRPLQNPHASTASLWIEDPFQKPGAKTPWFAKLFMTHPPIEERIKALREMSV